MASHRYSIFVVAAISLAIFAVACGKDFESTETPSSAPVFNAASEPTRSSVLTAVPTAFPTAAPTVAPASTATAVPPPRPGVIPTPTATPILELLTDPEQIVEIALANFEAADSYKADVTLTQTTQDDTWTRYSQIEVGPGERGLLAAIDEFRNSDRFELRYVEGFNYERQVEPVVTDWFEKERAVRPSAMDNLYTPLRWIGKAQLVDTRMEKGRMVYELTGEYWVPYSVPPPIMEGHEGRIVGSVTAVVDARTMLPVSMTVVDGREFVNLETGVMDVFFTNVIEAFVYAYGDITVDVTRPSSVATPQPPPHPATPTPTTAPPPA